MIHIILPVALAGWLIGVAAPLALPRQILALRSVAAEFQP